MRVRKIVILHGESVTLFAVVQYNIQDETDWEVVTTFRDRQSAEKFLLTTPMEAQNELPRHGRLDVAQPQPTYEDPNCALCPPEDL